jgi:hypothetical protein
MFRKILLAFFLFFLSLVFPYGTLAKGEFKVDVTTNYRVRQEGMVEVTQKVRIENLVSDLYATSFSIELENIDPINPRVLGKSGNTIPLEADKQDSKTTLTAKFEDAVVGRGEIRDFSFVFEEDSFATRTGEIWEIAIPRLSDEANFNSYSIYLIVPEAFGEEAYISPKPESVVVSEQERVYAFSGESVSNTGITAGFGQFQVFSYVLNYHLENPIAKSAQVDIAIPPDTAFQKVYINAIEPKPQSVYMDMDGNWLAGYTLKSKERIDVSVKGAVQIFASPRPFFKPSSDVLEANIKPSEFWQSDDPKIRQLTERLKTPKQIYDFVSQTLSYDYERVKPNVSRLGALGALDNPTQAICMEYTDLFIAIARAAGIPAREVNGYAYSENPEIQPLSLVADVLHSWPEYYDFTRGAWIPVDPTWGSTTGGVDFYNKLDLRHFSFVIHGQDPLQPFAPGSYKLGPNPQKDVFVNFGQLPENKSSTTEIRLLSNKFSVLSKSFKVEVENPGPAAIYDTSYHLYFDDELKTKERIDALLPYSIYKTQVAVPFSFLARKTPNSITLEIAGSRVTAPINKTQILAIQLLVIFIIFIFLIAAFYLRLKKISLKTLVLNFKNRIIGLVLKTANALKAKIFKKQKDSF